jgi:hypothetical protein
MRRRCSYLDWPIGSRPNRIKRQYRQVSVEGYQVLCSAYVAAHVVVYHGSNWVSSGGWQWVLLREFGPADGIPVPEGVWRARSVEKDSDGRVWLSLRRGISVVEPERLKSGSEPAIIHIESVWADGNPIVAATPLRAPANRVRIRFDYLALSLSAPERVKYRYRLDGSIMPGAIRPLSAIRRT